MRVIFFGTPDFGLTVLKGICDAGFDVVAVVTQPDKPRNRNVISFSPVKSYAIQKGIPVLQFDKIRHDGVESLCEIGADIAITAAYGQILSQQIIDLFPKGIYNVHASLLPKYRGASPIQWAIINGETETGITIMRTEVGLDTGDILLAQKVKISEDTTAGELLEKLAHLGAELAVQALNLIKSDAVIQLIPQDHTVATVCKMLNAESGAIDFDESAYDIHNLVRGLQPSPCAYAYLNGERCKIHTTRVRTDIVSNAESGTIVVADCKKGLVVKCGKFALQILRLQVPGKKIMQAHEFLNGHKLKLGDRLQNGGV